MGVAAHLFRIGNWQASERRAAVAQLHRDGRVLPKWSAAHLDWLVPAASAALVSCRQRDGNVSDGTRTDLDDSPATTLPHRTVLYRYYLGARRDLQRELRVS